MTLTILNIYEKLKMKIRINKMANNGTILGQDKNYKGKLPTKELKSAINKLKEQYQEREESINILGFEINGGEGLTKSGYEEMEKFQKWAKDKGMDAEYNSKSDLDNMTQILRNRVDNKNKN